LMLWPLLIVMFFLGTILVCRIFASLRFFSFPRFPMAFQGF
jgi:hypothetical protein